MHGTGNVKFNFVHFHFKKYIRAEYATNDAFKLLL